MKTRLDTLPEGITMEILDEYARNRENARRRADYARHPERVERHRFQTYTNFLNRHGQLVLPWPKVPPPWSELESRSILHAVECAMEAQNGGGSCANGK